MARPQIPDRLREEVEQIHKKHREYEASSFQEALGTVTDVAKGYRPTKVNSNPEYPEFEYEVTSSTKQIELTLTPVDSSDIHISDRGSQTQSKLVLSTGTTVITNEPIKSELEAIDNVKYGGLTFTGEIQVRFERDEVEDIQSVVDEVFETVNTVIQRKEDPVARVEQAAAKYAVPKEDE